MFKFNYLFLVCFLLACLSSYSFAEETKTEQTANTQDGQKATSENKSANDYLSDIQSKASEAAKIWHFLKFIFGLLQIAKVYH